MGWEFRIFYLLAPRRDLNGKIIPLTEISPTFTLSTFDLRREQDAKKYRTKKEEEEKEEDSSWKHTISGSIEKRSDEYYVLHSIHGGLKLRNYSTSLLRILLELKIRTKRKKNGNEKWKKAIKDDFKM